MCIVCSYLNRKCAELHTHTHSHIYSSNIETYEQTHLFQELKRERRKTLYLDPFMAAAPNDIVEALEWKRARDGSGGAIKGRKREGEMILLRVLPAKLNLINDCSVCLVVLNYLPGNGKRSIQKHGNVFFSMGNDLSRSTVSRFTADVGVVEQR